MEYVKDMVNIIGLMGVFIKVILIMGLDMGLEYGKIIKNCIKVIINMIRNKDMVFICGRKKKYLKEGLDKIIDKVMVKCMCLVGILNNQS
jgi:hypothetical protein